MIKLTLILDGEDSEQLVGLLAKALGRREQGIWSMAMEAIDQPMKIAQTVPHEAPQEARRGRPPDKPDPALKELIKRLPKDEKLKHKVNSSYVKGGAARKVMRIRGVAPASDILYAFIQKGPRTFAQLREELVRVGFSPASINTATQRLRNQHPDVRRGESGLYEIAAWEKTPA